MKIFLSACEPSSDIHGANLVEILRQQIGDLDFFGIGGAKLKEKGMRVLIDQKELSVMGTTEALGKLPKLIKILKQTTQIVDEEVPDVAILLDFPEFNTRLAKRLKKLGVPAIYYIPPKIWVWRKKRLHTLNKLFSKILYIFPFEQKIYQSINHKAHYVGNPLLDELPITLTSEEAREQLGIPKDGHVVTLMPGSRKAELRFHFDLFLDAALRVSHSLRGLNRLQEDEPLVVLIPHHGKNALDMSRFLKAWQADFLEKSKPSFQKSHLLDIRLVPEGSALALKASQAALVKSGTSTLEAALLGCPHAVVYKASKVTQFLYKTLVRYKGPVGLSNLVALNNLDSKTPHNLWPFSEILLDQVTPSRLTQELLGLFTDESKIEKQDEAFINILEHLKPPAQFDWATTLREVSQLKAHSYRRNIALNFLIGVVTVAVSFVWSLVNLLARILSSLGILKSTEIKARVISVGNLEAGGTGKTPVVAFLAQEALKRGLRVAILMRGYRSFWEDKGGIIFPQSLEKSESVRTAICGDEAALLHRLVPEAWIGVGKDRVESFNTIMKQANHQVELVILDDGFQNWKIKKDVEIAILTSRRWGSTYFREFPWAVKKARICLWTKGFVKPSTFGVPLIELKLENDLDKDNFREKHLWLVTGIADDQTLLRQLTSHHYVVDRHFKFSDHAQYNSKKVFSILEGAKSANARVALTGKDFVKWQELGVKAEQVWILEPEVRFNENQGGKDLLDKSLWG